MASTKVVAEFSCHDSRVSELITALRKTASELADAWRCSSISLICGLRCEQDVNHTTDRHTNDGVSWLVVAEDNIAVGQRVQPRKSPGVIWAIRHVSPNSVSLAKYANDLVGIPVTRAGFWDRYQLAE